MVALYHINNIIVRGARYVLRSGRSDMLSNRTIDLCSSGYLFSIYLRKFFLRDIPNVFGEIERKIYEYYLNLWTSIVNLLLLYTFIQMGFVPSLSSSSFVYENVILKFNLKILI